MASGAYDHPSFLTRQAIGLGVSTAGANGTSGGRGFISNMRVRKFAAAVRVAGTSSGAGHSAIILCVGTCITGYNGTALTTNTGTTTIGTLALGSSVAYTVSTSTDMNTMVQAGSVLALKNGTDATGTYDVTLEAYLDPGPNTSWTGPNN
jgi:hypothetical protein